MTAENRSQVYGAVDCFHCDPTVEMPIVIGSIPLYDSNAPNAGMVIPPLPIETTPLTANYPFPPLPANGKPSALPAPSAPLAEPNNASGPSVPFHTNPGQDLSELPTYEEATRTQNPNGIKPKYPMFRRNTSYSIDEASQA